MDMCVCTHVQRLHLHVLFIQYQGEYVVVVRVLYILHCFRGLFGRFCDAPENIQYMSGNYKILSVTIYNISYNL